MNSKQHALETMKFAHDTLVKTLKVVEGKELSQPWPEANHALWTMGHLATTYAWLATLIDAKANAGVPDSYNGLFGMESKPTGDAKKYPPVGEVRGAFEKSYALFYGLIEKLPEKDAWSAPAGEGYGFALSKLDCAYKCAWHDGWHAGQVSDIRRALKLPSIGK